MAIITLTTDWGLRDFYVAAVKGSMLSRLPSVNIVDISHMVDAHDIIQGAIILRNAFPHFPRGTVHFIGISSHRDTDVIHLAVEYQGHYFVGSDNGIFSLIMDKDPSYLAEIGHGQAEGSFAARDIFVDAACRLASGMSIRELGPARSSLWEKVMLKPVVDHNHIRGNVIYVDHFENVITNIRKELFEEAGKGKNFVLYLKKSRYHLDAISEGYGGTDPGDVLALFNSQGLLEISIQKGKAKSLLGLEFNDAIMIEFEEH